MHKSLKVKQYLVKAKSEGAQRCADTRAREIQIDRSIKRKRDENVTAHDVGYSAYAKYKKYIEMGFKNLGSTMFIRTVTR